MSSFSHCIHMQRQESYIRINKNEVLAFLSSTPSFTALAFRSHTNNQRTHDFTFRTVQRPKDYTLLYIRIKQAGTLLLSFFSFFSFCSSFFFTSLSSFPSPPAFTFASTHTYFLLVYVNIFSVVYLSWFFFYSSSPQPATCTSFPLGLACISADIHGHGRMIFLHMPTPVSL